MVFTPNEAQAQAIELIEQFCNSSETCFLLQGSAGTGKTALVHFLLKGIFRGMQIQAVAPTHKSAIVLHRAINSFRSNPVLTLASFLGKIPRHGYIGSKNFVKEERQRRAADLYILDEVSMVSDSDFDDVYNYIKKSKKKLLCIGDRYQIPAISQPLYKDGPYLSKKDCKVFNAPNNFELKETIRQKEGCKIIEVATYIKDRLYEELDVRAKFPECVISLDEVYTKFASVWPENPYNIKIISYTNLSVENHNDNVRKELGYDGKEFVVGEILTGYENLGFPELIIQNGIDYRVGRVDRVNNYNLRGSQLVGNLITISSESATAERELFFPDIDADENREILNELIRLAEKNNKRHSTKNDYKNYRQLKDSLIFRESLYRFGDEFYTGSVFKKKHSLLFTKVMDVIDEKNELKNNKLAEQLTELYPYVIKNRLLDDKTQGEQETFANCFCIVSKDIDYGYAITAHKSQGSSFKTAFVHESNFSVLKNRYNKKYGEIEHRVKEQNQLKYVAVTRPSKELYLF